MKYPLHIVIRRKLTTVLNKLLSLFKKSGKTLEYVERDEIKSILLIRPNYRIGNIIFLAPLINELSKALPNAKIDVIVGSKISGKILEPMPNVNRVIDIPRKLLLQPINLYKLIKDTREVEYDIAFNISGASTSAQIVNSLIKAKNKAGFDDSKLWSNFTHLQDRGERTYKHMGLESLEFLRFLKIDIPKNATLDIKLKPEEIEEAKADLESLLSSNSITDNSKIIAIFRNARFDKRVNDEYWSAIIDEVLKIDNSVTFIDILSPDIPTKLNSKVLSYSNKNLRVLGAFFKLCNLYVSADTGPMHLAVASGAKVLALFNKTDIEVYGALGDGNKTIDIENLLPKSVAKTICGLF